MAELSWSIGLMSGTSMDGVDAALLKTDGGDRIEAGPALTILDPQFFPAVHDPQRYGQYVEAVGEVARREAVPVFGRYDAMREWHRNDAESFKAALWTDGFHMSDAGYDCLARDMANAMLGMTAPSRPVVAASR